MVAVPEGKVTLADLQNLFDENAIRGLIASYSDAVTHLDATRAAAIFTEDGIVSVVGVETAGRATIEEGIGQSFAAFAMLQLVAHGGMIALNGDRATARWSVVEIGVRKGAQDLNVMLGRYEDQLVRTAEGWRCARRSYTLAGRSLIEAKKFQANPDFLTGLLVAAPDS